MAKVVGAVPPTAGGGKDSNPLDDVEHMEKLGVDEMLGVLDDVEELLKEVSDAN